MAKLYFATQSGAQNKSDLLHAWLQANIPAYAASVAAGRTLRWFIAAQDRDAAGNVIPGSLWGVVVKQRCRGALSAQDIIDAGL